MADTDSMPTRSCRHVKPNPLRMIKRYSLVLLVDRQNQTHSEYLNIFFGFVFLDRKGVKFRFASVAVLCAGSFAKTARIL